MISIVIPTYNRSKTIIKSVKSVLNQSYSDLEVIIVDDCSTDDTQIILQQLCDERIRYIRHDKNKGACAARNTGIEAAQGKYIAFHDSDDIWNRDKLFKQINILEKKQADIVFCAFKKFNYAEKDGEIFPNICEGFKTQRDIIMGFYVSTQTIIGRKDVFNRYKFDITMPRMQDYDLMVRISETEKVYFLNESLVDVYLQPDSISSKSNWYSKTEEISNKLLRKYPDLSYYYPEWKIEMLNRIAHCRVMQGTNYCSTYRIIWKTARTVPSFLKYLLARFRVIKLFLLIKN